MAKILYFEDDKKYRELISSFLGNYGHTDSYANPDIFILEKGDKALLEYDLLVTDNSMPNGMRGIDFVKKYIQGKGINLKVLFHFGGDERVIKEAGILNYRFVLKPEDPQKLFKTIEEMLKQDN